MSKPFRDDGPAKAGDPASPPRDPVEALVEEFFESRRRGDASDVDDFALRVPGREVEFRKLVEALDVLEVAAAVASPRAIPKETRERLGRFRLLRLVGRGGMGAVYEAIDEELGRHVALKILPGHATLDAREIARFRREAQAAARLSHAHIVPVFGIGEDDGVHWLAMQFIEGESLDRVLRAGDGDGGAGTRPRFAAADVARHGLALADALALAHAEGVLHRDVKPSNVLLDRSGTVWITDFGLAQSEGSASITRTGETVGTPRYMAPEAFQGWADPRTDVWGVGATLYELLAGRPAFDATDRARLSRQIADVEPVSLRRVDATIPADLATIVHKCLQKEPAARYATARELADDLSRYLAGEPIRARPPSLAYRLGLVARRHRVAMGAGVAIAVAFVVVLVAWSVTLSYRKSEALAARRRAEKNLATAMTAIDRLLTRVGDSDMLRVPGMEAASAALLNDALQLDLALLEEQQDDAALRFETARARARAATIHSLLGHPESALAASRTAAEELGALLAAGAPEEARHERAGVLEVEARAETDLGRPDDAERSMRLAADEAALHATRAPACVEAAGACLDATTHLAEVLAGRRSPAEAIARVEPPLAAFERSHGDFASAPTAALRSAALAWTILARCHEAAGATAAARDDARHACERTEALVARPDRFLSDDFRRAEALATAAELASNERVEPDSSRRFEEAEALLAASLARYPAALAYRLFLPRILDQHARALQRSGDLGGARLRFRRALELLDAIRSEGSKDSGDIVQQFVAISSNLGSVEVALGSLADADADFEGAIAAGEAWLARGGERDSLVRSLATAHGNRVVVARMRGDWPTMQSEAERSLARIDEVARRFPDDPVPQIERCRAISFVGEAHLHARRPHEAAAEFERSVAAADAAVARFGATRAIRGQRAICKTLLGNALRLEGRRDDARAALAYAESEWRAMHEADAGDADAGLRFVETLVDAALLERTHDACLAASARDGEAVRIAADAIARAPDSVRARALLHIAFGGLLADLDHVIPGEEIGEAMRAASPLCAADPEALRLIAKIDASSGASWSEHRVEDAAEIAETWLAGALATLRTLADAGQCDAAFLAEPVFAPLNDRAEFRELVRRLAR